MTGGSEMDVPDSGTEEPPRDFLYSGDRCHARSILSMSV